jgi:uncharacterized LabA/DUF88 family protein
MEKKIAILIDGENAESAYIGEYIVAVGTYGRVTVKRIYADWTNQNMRNWKEKLNKFAIRPMQKFAYTTGKGSTDTALIIDAMDLLHSKLIDGICIVSSDSDYTGLAHRIREEGLFIMGIGKKHTPEAFIKACEIFTFTENLVDDLPQIVDNQDIKNTANTLPKKEANGKKATAQQNTNSTSKFNIGDNDWQIIASAYQMTMDTNGWALLSQLATALKKVDSAFDHKNFSGFRTKTFRQFCEALSPVYKLSQHEDKVTYSLKKVD